MTDIVTTAKPVANSLSSAGLLVFRIVTGSVLLIHGIPKLGHPGDVAGFVASSGIPFPTVSAWLTIIGEVGLGLAVLLGALTRVVGVLLAVLMGLIWGIMHVPEGVLTDGQGVNGESALLLAVGGVLLALVGAGGFSADAVLKRLRQR